MQLTVSLFSLIFCVSASAEMKTYMMGPSGHTHGIMSFGTAERMRQTELAIEDMNLKVVRKLGESGLYVVEADAPQMEAMASTLESSGVIIEENVPVTLESEIELIVITAWTRR